MAIIKETLPAELPFRYHPDTRGIRLEPIDSESGRTHYFQILNFRNPKHLLTAATHLEADQNVAFSGWGVMGYGRRVDFLSNYQEFWELKTGRASGSKVPLLEPAGYAVEHVDWDQIHAHFRYLQNPRALRRLWHSALPFHIILPYNKAGRTLTEAVVTNAFDPDVAPTTPVPTFCLFGMEDPAIVKLLDYLKRFDPNIQIGVTSLNETGEKPSFNTPELLNYFRDKHKITTRIIIEDPLVEPIDIASSHSQFVAPLKDQKPVWQMIRRGSVSPEIFERTTGFTVEYAEDVKVAARRVSNTENLDPKTQRLANLLKKKYPQHYFLRSLIA